MARDKRFFPTVFLEIQLGEGTTRDARGTGTGVNLCLQSNKL